jgi:hypothetical protein
MSRYPRRWGTPISLQHRLTKLRRAIGGLPPPGQLELVVAVGDGADMAEGRPPGVYYNADGRVATVVFAGPGPDRAMLGSLEARLAPWGMVIVNHPEEEPSRPSTVWARSVPGGSTSGAAGAS